MTDKRHSPCCGAELSYNPTADADVCQACGTAYGRAAEARFTPALVHSTSGALAQPTEAPTGLTRMPDPHWRAYYPQRELTAEGVTDAGPAIWCGGAFWTGAPPGPDDVIAVDDLLAMEDDPDE